MAISRDKKNTLVAELVELFSGSKASAGALYTGLSVAKIQELRKLAREENVTIKIVKNRLVKVALSQLDTHKNAETGLLNGQLLYAFSESDEVAPAQVIAKFAKSNPEINLIVGFDANGVTQDTQTVRALSELPTKDELKGQLLSVFSAPLTQFMSVAGGAQRGFVQVLHQKASK